MSSLLAPSLHAIPFHQLTTPRLILRSAILSDAKAVCILRSDSRNNPHGGVHEPDLSAEVQAQRIEEQNDSTAEGKNAWMQVILKPELAEHVVDDLVVEDGILIGMTGFNSFSLGKDVEGNEALVGDTGAMIDYRYTRKGYGLEAMEAVFEYGLNELGCGMLSLDTFALNAPWRKLMKTMGLEDVEQDRKIGDSEGSLGEEIEYKFDKRKWEEGKKGLREAGKWYL